MRKQLLKTKKRLVRTVRKLNLEKENCFLIGTFSRTHGIKGALVLDKEIDFSEIIKLESVLVEINQLLVPFFVANHSFRNEYSYLISIDDVESEVDAAKFVGKRVYLPNELIKKSTPESEIINKGIEGYAVIDKNQGAIGFVKYIEEISGNDLIAVDHDGTEILIPFQDSIILSIDKKKSIVEIDAPEGLIDLYLD